MKKQIVMNRAANRSLTLGALSRAKGGGAPEVPDLDPTPGQTDPIPPSLGATSNQ